MRLFGTDIARSLNMSYATLFNLKDIKYYHFYGRFPAQLDFAGFGLNSVRQDFLWLRISNIIKQVCEKEPASIGAFVLMNNHFHGILRVQRERRFHWTVAFEQHCKDHFFEFEEDLRLEEGVHLIQINNYKVLKETIRYIYKNPVQAGLCQRAIDYPYSTFRQILRPHTETELRPISPIEDPLCLILNPFQIEK